MSLNACWLWRVIAGNYDALARVNEHSFGILTPRWKTDNFKRFMRRLSKTLGSHACGAAGESVQP